MICLLLVFSLGTGRAFAASDPRPQRGGLKIEVSKAGVYRLTGADLSNAGVIPVSIDPTMLRMFHLDSEIALHVVWNDAGGGDSDHIDFYATGIDNQYTGTDVYWLYWGGNTPGIRMAQVDGSAGDTPTQASDFMDVLNIEENHVPWLNTPGAPGADYWFWENITSPYTNTYRFDIPSPLQNAENAVVTVYFQGRTDVSQDSAHHTVIRLNGGATPIGDETWTGGIAYAQAMSVSQTLLHNGSNTLTIESDGDGVSPDVIYFNRITIEYRRKLEAVSDRLTFFLNQSQPVRATVSGFREPSIGIYDITDPDRVKILSNADIQADQGGFAAGFKAAAGEQTCLVFTESAVQTPARTRYREMSDLKDISNGADYIVITSEELKPALEKLCEEFINEPLLAVDTEFFRETTYYPHLGLVQQIGRAHV